ncbi:MAG TPA: signal peptidase II, partial [Clostridia bacterium]|nr:signal peptidase II [Clostridia bacterium]
MVWITALVFAADRLSKFWAYHDLRLESGGSIPLWPDVLHLTYAQNTGMAFSMFPGQRLFLILIPLFISVGILVAQARARTQPRYPRVLGWMILGGALGNLYDRVFYGFVVDFVEIKLFRFAIFNLADSFLCVASVLLAGWILWADRHGANLKHE